VYANYSIPLFSLKGNAVRRSL